MKRKAPKLAIGHFLHKLTINARAETAIFKKKDDFFVKAWDKTRKSLPLRR
jgi:hypothetical protein